MKDTKEYYFHIVSKLQISFQLYFKDTYDVIALTMATRQVHKKVLYNSVIEINLIHSADVCSLVMACVGYTCAHAAKNPQNSFTFASVFLPKCIFILQQLKVNTIPKPVKKNVCHVWTYDEQV